MNIQFSASALGTRNLATQGGGQFLLLANAFSPVDGAAVSTRTLDKPASSTADYYHMDGLYGFCPYDLNAMGSWGQAIATAKGFRYVWIIGCDHPGSGSGNEGGWAFDATGVYAGFSNNPRILPDPSTMFRIIEGINYTVPGVAGTGVMSQAFVPCLVYNSDDPTNPAYLYVEMNNQAGAGLSNSLNMVLFKGPDFDTAFSPVGVSHACTGQFGLTSYQRVYRLSTGSWVSWGGGDPANNGGLIAKWSSTDGVTFSIGALTKATIDSTGASASSNGSGGLPVGWLKHYSYGGFRFQIGSDWYIASVEDCRGPGWSSSTAYPINAQVNINQVTYKSLANGNANHDPTTDAVSWQNLGYLGQYVALVPVDVTTGDINITGTPPIIRLSTKYLGVYPNATYLQIVMNYVEDGLLFALASHGFFGDTGLVANELPENGGGLNEQYIDLYGYVFDAVAAANAAPSGLVASCVAGVVTLSWDDLPSGRTYRTKRYTSLANANADTSGTSVGDVTGTTITDTPTTGSVYYYRTWALAAGTPQGSRVVSTYVS